MDAVAPEGRKRETLARAYEVSMSGVDPSYKSPYGVPPTPPPIPAPSPTPAVVPPTPPAVGYPPGGFATKNHRILAGETIGCNFWSNVAATLVTWYARVVYDNGLPDDFTGGPVTLGSVRALQTVWAGNTTIGGTPAKKAAFNGWVVSFLVWNFSGITQRGQTYAEAGTVTGDGNRLTDLLAADYIFIGNPLQLDRYAPPGPAGGHGMITTANEDNPAAGVQHAAQTVPIGAIWKIRGYRETVTAFTAAAKSISLIGTLGSSFQTICSSPNFTPAAAAGSIRLVTGPVTSTLDTVLNAIVVPLGEAMFKGSDTWTLVLNGIAGGDDLASGTYNIEEWVMPN
jgi:hypothetical protein